MGGLDFTVLKHSSLQPPLGLSGFPLGGDAGIENDDRPVNKMYVLPGSMKKAIPCPSPCFLA